MLKHKQEKLCVNYVVMISRYRIIWNKTLKKTNMVVAEALFDP